MSCIRFNTTAQRSAMRSAARDAGPLQLSSGDAAVLHLSPPVTESKIQRLRLLAQHENPRIRESVASSPHTPEDLFVTLSFDVDEGVRSCVARNEATPCDVLRALSADPSERVRGWLALNFFVPDDTIRALKEDASRTVRGLASWKSELTTTKG